jgi:hypothetical protein
MDDFPRFQFNDEEGKQLTEEEVCHLQEITRPRLCRMIAEECLPTLATSSFWMNLPHILLNSAFTHPNIQLEELAPNALSSPEAVVCCHLLHQSDRLGRESRLAHMRLRYALPLLTEELTRPSQKRLWLDKEECLFPGSDHPSQKHQQKPISFLVDRSFDVATQDDQLLPQQRVFGQQFGFSSGHIGECSEQKRGRSWFYPTRKTFLDRVKAEKYSLLD